MNPYDRKLWEVWIKKCPNLKWAENAIGIFTKVKVPRDRGFKPKYNYTILVRFNVVTVGGGFNVYEPYPRKIRKIEYSFSGWPVAVYYNNPQLAYRWDRHGD